MANSIDWNRLDAMNPRVDPSICPKVSIIIPTRNDAKKIGFTLDSLIAQDYPDFEILVIDAASSDRTIEIVKSFRNEKIHLSSVSSSNRFEMLNKGIFLARGSYLNFIFPGDYYLNPFTLQVMMHFALAKDRPKLVYCGCFIREGSKEPKVLFKHFTLEQLKCGKQPTSLQSCWFHRMVFHEIGKFDARYQVRGGFDLLSRFMLYERLSYAGLRRILTEYDLRDIAQETLFRHFYETLRIILRHFGVKAMLSWLFRQNDAKRYFRNWFGRAKKTLVGRKNHG